MELIFASAVCNLGFKVGSTYRHVETTDVDMYVTCILFACDEYWELEVEWRMQRHQNMILVDSDKIQVATCEFGEWSLLQ